MSCGNGCGCCPRCGCNRQCTCNRKHSSECGRGHCVSSVCGLQCSHLVRFFEQLERFFSY